MGKKVTTKDFIKKAIEVHGDRYDYSKVVYRDSKTKVTIICNEHGEFEQLPSNHLKPCHCPKCSGVFRYNTESFIEKAKQVHGDKFSYENSIYKSAHKPLLITCSLHGDWSQSPTSHFSGAGCPACNFERARLEYSCTQEEFVEKAKRIRPDWDYSRVVYKGSHTHVTVVCEEGHVMQKTPTKILSGDGCAICFNENNNGFLNWTIINRDKELSDKEYHLYHVRLNHPVSGESFSKVGISRSLHTRFAGFYPYKTEVISIIKGTLSEMFELEQLILNEIKEKGIKYRPSCDFGGKTECFKGGLDELRSE